MSKPSKDTIKRRLRELRKLIDASGDPAVQRVAQGMEDAIRWATEDTVGWPAPSKNAIALAGLIYQEIRK